VCIQTQRREEKRPFLLRLLFFFEGEGKFLKIFPFFFPTTKKKEKITHNENNTKE